MPNQPRCADPGCDEDIFAIVRALVRGEPPPIRADVYRMANGRWMLLDRTGAQHARGRVVPYHVVYCAVRFGAETLPATEWTGPQPPHCFDLSGLRRGGEIDARLSEFACVPIVRDNHEEQYAEALARAQREP